MAWQARDYVYALLLFSGVVALFYLMVFDMSNAYGRGDLVNPSFADNYNNLNENAEFVSDMLNKSSSESGLTILGTAEVLISSSFSVINLIYDGIGTLGSQIGHIGEEVGIPTEVQRILVIIFMGIITIGLIFVIINALNKTDKL